MPATNYTPIQLYRSTTSGALPSNANLSPGEVALNIADNDMSMYFENASGTVKRFFNNPAELKYPTADGTSGQFLTTNGSGVLSFGSVTAGALTNNTRQAVTSSATTTINLNSGNVIDLTMAASITSLSFTNVPASGTPILIQIVVKNASDGTGYNIAWPNSVYWSGQYVATSTATVQTAPTLATGANGITVIALLTTDGGTKWRGWVEATIPGGSFSSLYSWGMNDQGRLGINNTYKRSSPTQIGSLTNWASAVTGLDFSAAIKTDGTLWTWGANNVGQLGTTAGNTSSPIQVGALTNWSKVSASGGGCCAAIKTDGSLWTWGFNNYGQLGQNDLTTRSSPAQVGALTTWSKVSLGYKTGAAIKTDGTLWIWGDNNFGQLGQGNTTSRSSPVQVGALTNWSDVSVAAGGNNFSAAIKTDGTLWTWGSNFFGGLGQNNAIDRSSPIQVGALTNWSKVSVGSNMCAAIKTDGTLWTWGLGNAGRLGQNNSDNLSSPVQVGALTNWSSVTTYASCMATKTDGTLWSWGLNSQGNLGQYNTINLSSPVQVGGSTNWTFVATCLHVVAGRGTTINPA
jgi:alpha-tubulin suppressor-like RCC1 family protein